MWDPPKMNPKYFQKSWIRGQWYWCFLTALNVQKVGRDPLLPLAVVRRGDDDDDASCYVKEAAVVRKTASFLSLSLKTALSCFWQTKYKGVDAVFEFKADQGCKNI